MVPRLSRTRRVAIAVGAAVIAVVFAVGVALVTVLSVRTLGPTSAPGSTKLEAPPDSTSRSQSDAATPPIDTQTSTSSRPTTANDLDSLAIESLAALQDQSIDQQVEFCASIVADGTTLSTTPVQRGDHESCSILDPLTGEVVASFHTHGNHDPEYWGEVPSDADVEGDMADGIPGYVGTPGGRVWVSNANDGSVELLCGVGCIPADPAYRAEDTEPFADEMTYEELLSYLSR